MSTSSTESLIQRKQKPHQNQNVINVGQRKRHRKHDVEAVVSLDDISVKDVEEENYEDDEDAKQRPGDWDDDDRRWGS